MSSRATEERHADVVVVGAGPAGAAIAILLAEHGLDVTVLDRAALPREKICGEYLSPEAARVLDRLGVLKEFGNMSSATILFVLEHMLQHETPVPGEWGLLVGLGPGFAAEGALLRW